MVELDNIDYVNMLIILGDAEKFVQLKPDIKQDIWAQISNMFAQIGKRQGYTC